MSRQEVSLYMSYQYFKSYQSATLKANMVAGLISVLGAAVAAWIVVSIIWQVQEDDARQQCNEIAKNSSYVTKFTGTTCWIQINDGADGVTSEAWVPSGWMTMG